MTDRELLELAAKAVGYDTSHPMNRERLWLDHPVDALWVSENGKLIHTAWSPLTDDGDALRLAVKLRLHVDTSSDLVQVFHDYGGVSEKFEDSDPYSATRRAIVRAAAELASNP